MSIEQNVPAEEMSDAEKKKKEQFEATATYYKEKAPLAGFLLGDWGYQIKVDPNVPTAYFDHERKTLVMGSSFIELFEETGDMPLQYNEKERLDFNVFHEVGHFAQLLNDPKSFMETFAMAEEKGREAEERGPEGVGQYVKNAWGRFWNSALDAHDNHFVHARSPRFQKLSDEKGVPIFEEDNKFLFPQEARNTRGKGASISMQFSNALNMYAMEQDPDLQMDPQVEELLQSEINYFGKTYSAIDFLKEKVADGRMEFQTVYRRIRDHLAPLFEKAVQMDIENQRIHSVQQDVMHGLDEKTASKIAEGHMEAQQVGAGSVSEGIKKHVNERAKELGFNEREISRMNEIKNSVDGIYPDLAQLWEHFVARTVELETDMQGMYRSGEKLSVRQFVKDLPTFLSEPSESRLFERRVLSDEKETIRPKKISLYLIPDLSGSMTSEKRQAVQEVSYALIQSLIAFKRNLTVFLEEGEEPPVNINFEVIGFGSKVLTLFEKNVQEKNERSIDIDSPDMNTRLWKSLFGIEEESLGGTADMYPLKQVQDDLMLPSAQESLLSDQEISIVLEITDGETATADISKRIVNELNNTLNVFARAIQIQGSVLNENVPMKNDDSENLPPEYMNPTGIFREVWGEDGKKLEDLSMLKDLMFAILSEALQKREERLLEE